MGKEGEKLLIGLSPMGIVKNPENVFVIVFHKELLRKEESKQSVGRFAFELGRWKAPEILKEEEEKETEQSCVFTIATIAHTIVMRKKPFDGDSDEIAMKRIMMGERPCVKEMEERRCDIVEIMKECWHQTASERLSFAEVKLNLRRIRYGRDEEVEEDDHKNYSEKKEEGNEKDEEEELFLDVDDEEERILEEEFLEIEREREKERKKEKDGIIEAERQVRRGQTKEMEKRKEEEKEKKKEKE
jgi:hypothetical protein